MLLEFDPNAQLEIEEATSYYDSINRTLIKFKLSPKPSRAEKDASGKSGFVVIPVRWVVERSNAWVKRGKSLVKNFDRTLDNANARLQLCFVRLMLKRLAEDS